MIKFLAFDGRQVSVVSPLPHALEFRGPAFGVSSDGRFVLSTNTQETSDLMLVENFR